MLSAPSAHLLVVWLVVWLVVCSSVLLVICCGDYCLIGRKRFTDGRKQTRREALWL
jgi:hypothetical protein